MDPRSKSGGPDKVSHFRFDRLEERIAPAIVLVNPGGNTPQGSGANNGQAIGSGVFAIRMTLLDENGNAAASMVRRVPLTR